VKIPKMVELKKKRSEENKGKLGESSDKKEGFLGCQRCCIISASRECTQCRAKYYCEHCFKTIHASSKLANHHYVAIKQNEEKLMNG
jgi:late competence protein required for DNA uptake (superfamily II DNA/RNA helicase)